jgi:capsular exopolysaccharide synthesis family protein
VITVSSAAPQDGKSFVSLNLALSFSMEHGRRTILVDCDLRSPSVDKYLGIPPQEGLVQYLTKGRLAPHCYMRRFENLYVLTAGGVTPNPIELLSMRKMTDLIAQLRKDFDTIILDAPPYSPIADARVVAGLSDGLIMVVRRGKTTYASADRAFKAIDRNKFLGVVFNDVKQTIFSSYQDLNYYYAGAGPHSRRDGGQARIVGSDKYLNS